VLQLRVDALPEATAVGVAVNKIVGTGNTTVTVALWAAAPPAPVQASAKTLVAFSAPVEAEPESAFVPLHAPEAAQSVAFVLLHVSVELSPGAMLVGLAENCSVGGGGGGACVETRTDLCVLPPGPTQSSVKVLSDAMAGDVSLPFTARAPDHASEAVQLVAFVVVQDSDVFCPTVTSVGVAVNESVGVGALTVTVRFCVEVPPVPVHAKVNDVVVCSAAVTSVPEVPLLPDQPPLAEQADALVLLHVRVEVAPWLIVVGFAEKVTVGSGSMVTLAVALADPPAPVQVSVKSVAPVSAAVISLPAVGLLPDQPPDAAQEVAFVVLQLRVEVLPEATETGFAANVTVGRAFTVTVTLRDVVPPAPVQASVNVLFDASEAETSLPFTGRAPGVHSPEAVQLVALLDVQESEVFCPAATDVGVAVRVSVGAGLTVTVTLREVLPPGPVQTSVNVLFDASAAEDSLSLVAFVPDQAPEAVQPVALVELQVRVVALPAATEVGFAANDTVGTGNTTVTVTLCAAVPPAPVQASPKRLVAFSAPVDAEPESCFVPLHAPDAAQSVAFVLIQESVELPPGAVLEGLAEN
jgi:hypothetical protein